MNDYENELYHHGILGQKWGVRRYQNPDGSLTVAGRKRYSKFVGGDKKKSSTIELASIGAARQHLESMNPQSRNKYLQKKQLQPNSVSKKKSVAATIDANMEKAKKTVKDIVEKHQDNFNLGMDTIVDWLKGLKRRT